MRLRGYCVIDKDLDDLATQIAEENNVHDAQEFVMALDAQMGSWEFSARMRDYFVAEMAKHEMTEVAR